MNQTNPLQHTNNPQAKLLDLPFSPAEVFAAFSDQPGCVFLDSGRQAYGLGRYSILALRPWRTFCYKQGRGFLDDNHTGIEIDPFTWLGTHTSWKQEPQHPLPFCGGAIGYLSYDLGRHLEKLPNLAAIDEEAPALHFGCYSCAVVFDHQKEQTWLIGSPALPSFASLWSWWEEHLHHFAPKPRQHKTLQIGELSSNMSPETYKAAVSRVRHYIKEGDVYQANIAQRFASTFADDPVELYLRLREASPAPYAAYLHLGSERILSSSPEKLLTLRGQDIETRPIKGTRKRGQTPEEDALHWEALKHSEKDRAELLMIVDLERNDLGRVCQPGSVETIDLFGLEGYATVIHQTATVRGTLREDLGAIDAIKAMFPGGSITGAPKIRAMEVIEELEPHRRGIYTGSIGYISADGQMDWNIAIRTMRCAREELTFSVGGGIVWDSDPQAEYEETLIKAKAMMQACGKSIDQVHKAQMQQQRER